MSTHKKSEKKTPTLEEIERLFDKKFRPSGDGRIIGKERMGGDRRKKFEFEAKTTDIKSFYRKHIIKMMESERKKAYEEFFQTIDKKFGSFKIDVEMGIILQDLIKKIK